MDALIRFIKYLRPYWLQVTIISLLMVFSAAVTTIVPQITRIVIDKIILSGDMEQLSLIITLTVGLLGTKSLLNWYRVKLNFKIAQDVLYDLSKDLTNHLYRLSTRYYEQNITGRIMSRVISDVNSLQQMIVMGSSQLIEQGITIFGVLIFIFIMDWQLSLATLVLFPILIVVVVTISGMMRR
ncbi:MAG: ABC transporter transmembrane domain-containing protein, partial [Bacillota bacterium]|nr:ABC transporter transmembrane domain-containing protein [Bacillota bacterium]